MTSRREAQLYRQDTAAKAGIARRFRLSATPHAVLAFLPGSWPARGCAAQGFGRSMTFNDSAGLSAVANASAASCSR